LRRYCVFDLEATGPDPDHDFITQIGAVIIENGAIQEHQTFETLVKPPKPIPEKIERLTGISNHELETARSFAEVFEEFREFCKGSVLVTQAGYEWPTDHQGTGHRYEGAVHLFISGCLGNRLHQLPDPSTGHIRPGYSTAPRIGRQHIDCKDFSEAA